MIRWNPILKLQVGNRNVLEQWDGLHLDAVFLLWDICIRMYKETIEIQIL